MAKEKEGTMAIDINNALQAEEIHMTREEALALDKKEIAELLNAQLEKGVGRMQAPSALGLTGADLSKMGIFFNKGSFSA